MVTQIEIAKVVGLDVSSVNKILNRRQGSKFRKETVSHVFKVARRMGYNFDRNTKGTLAGEVERLRAALKDMTPSVLTPEEIAARANVTPARAKEIRELAYGRQSA